MRRLTGLPGAGKSTLIALVAAWLARRKLRLVILVSSIIDAMKKIVELDGYGIRTALLAGQTGATRQNHARRFLRKIGAVDGHGLGLADEPMGSGCLAAGCALEAFGDDPGDDRRFSRLDPPCSKIEQDGRPAMCPRASWCCGRMVAQRALVNAPVWVDHILSPGTKVPRHSCAEDITYSELVARIADVVVDEADEVRHVADARVLGRIAVVGTVDSIQARIFEELHVPFSTGRNGLGPVVT